MRDYDETYRHPRTMNEAFGPYTDLDLEPDTQNIFEVIWYIVKSILSGIGMLTVIAVVGYFWSQK